jgi:hypothetical protein
MIPSQQSMMLDLAKNFEKLVKDPKVSRKDFVFDCIRIFFWFFVKNEVVEVMQVVK